MFLHPRFWIGILKHNVLRHFSSLKKFRAFLPESIFGHFRSYALKIGIIRDFGHHWKTRVACPLLFSEAVGSAEPVAFQKSSDFFIKKSHKKKAWNMGKRSAKCKKQSLERSTPAIFSGGGVGCIKFGPVKFLREIISGRIHVALVFDPPRIQENTPGELFIRRPRWPDDQVIGPRISTCQKKVTLSCPCPNPDEGFMVFVLQGHSSGSSLQILACHCDKQGKKHLL